jgi:nanoRNase/pAp phosphatase (c-di-AMP/oligoRNAs hydrolase)
MTLNIEKFSKLVDSLKHCERVIVQTHDFPDHDAVASAFALGYILESKGIVPVLAYTGHIDRISLQNMIDWLKIPICHTTTLALTPHDKIIIVDGCIGEDNVTDLPGIEVAVIDHHQNTPPGFVSYKDVRPDFGSSSTILAEYYEQLGISMPKPVATALLVGLGYDTANLTRSFIGNDLVAFAKLRAKADVELASKISRNQFVLDELGYFTYLFENLKRDGRIAFAMLPDSCPENMLGMLSDFVLGIHEIDIVILTAKRDNSIQITLRSECPMNNVGEVARKTLNCNQIGFGGGHRHMAGGIVNYQHAKEMQRCPEILFDLFRENLID